MTQQNNLPIDPSCPAPTPRKKTMTEAALAANGRNAQKSTGPRTPAGKLRAASNALQHGLYSPRSLEQFVHDNQLALEVITNTLEQFRPITPAEHFLTHQLIHMQLRFLQMEVIYGQAMEITIPDLLAKPAPFLTQILRELNSLPRQISRTMKEIRAEQSRRARHLEATSQNFEIETHPRPTNPPHHARPAIGPNIAINAKFTPRRKPQRQNALRNLRRPLRRPRPTRKHGTTRTHSNF